MLIAPAGIGGGGEVALSWAIKLLSVACNVTHSTALPMMIMIIRFSGKNVFELEVGKLYNEIKNHDQIGTNSAGKRWRNIGPKVKVIYRAVKVARHYCVL